MLRTIFAILGLTVIAGVMIGSIACSAAPAAAGSASDSPTEAYKRLYNAVKSKNTDAIKAEMSKATLQFAEMASERNKTPIEKVFENGFSASTFAATLPPIRDQRIKDEMGAIEVWDAKNSKWEDTPFIKEDGAWKLAVGDLFKGTYRSPGPGRAQLEKIAANNNGSGPVELPAPNMNANANANVSANANATRPASNGMPPRANAPAKGVGNANANSPKK